MKKFFAILLASFMLLSLFSCAGDGSGSDTATDTDTRIDDGTDTSAAADTGPSMPECDYSISVTEEIIVVHETDDGRKSTKVLRYPVLSGMSDAALEDSINASFRDIAEREFILTVPDVDIYIIEDTIFNYEVSEVEVAYLSNNFISVRNSVYSMSSISTYPDCPVYTVNIDLTSGEVIDETDIFSDFNVITSRFIAGDFDEVYGMENLLSETNYEDMILQYKSDYASYPEVYFTPGYLVVCIDLVSALESSAGFSISLDEVSDGLLFIPN